ncbi:MAG: hypothetical protein JSU82_06375 [Rhodospirillales bacterium]|nr:MAG: hypothetical protein JSU82_06375 [Rhodospirillales bacterium]
MNESWLTELLHRVDKRCAGPGDESEPLAGRFSALYWLAFFALAFGVPVGLWHSRGDVAGLIGPVWQSLAERLAG